MEVKSEYELKITDSSQKKSEEKGKKCECKAKSGPRMTHSF